MHQYRKIEFCLKIWFLTAAVQQHQSFDTQYLSSYKN